VVNASCDPASAPVEAAELCPWRVVLRLIADSRRQRGTRPDFSTAARPEIAEPLYEHFCQALRDLGVPIETGVFGARMEVELVNNGPVTIVLDVD
jgi:D-aminoacyl-tRNA deacylase